MLKSAHKSYYSPLHYLWYHKYSRGKSSLSIPKDMPPRSSPLPPPVRRSPANASTPPSSSPPPRSPPQRPTSSQAPARRAPPFTFASDRLAPACSLLPPTPPRSCSSKTRRQCGLLDPSTSSCSAYPSNPLDCREPLVARHCLAARGAKALGTQGVQRNA
jgi:hypothetical protein